MKIAVTGANGRVGQELVKAISKDPRNQILRVVYNPEKANDEHSLEECIENIDVVIDFTSPESTLEFANICQKHGKALVSGTTGFSNDQLAELGKIAETTPLLWSSNMSLGINLLMKLSQQSAKILGDDFDVEILEAHHRNKVDAPSGTALMVGKAIAETKGANFDDVKDLNRQQEIRPRKDGSIGFSSIRAGNIAGTLNVMFANNSEIIELKHQAMNRSVYAEGALKAAKWLLNQKPGKLYHTQDMFDYL